MKSIFFYFCFSFGPGFTSDSTQLWFDCCITSAVSLSGDPAPAEAFRLPEIPGVGVVFETAEGAKCQRSWKILPDVGRQSHAAVCGRCDGALG